LQNFTDADFEIRGLRVVSLKEEHVLQFKMSKENVEEFATVYKQDPIAALLGVTNHHGSFAVLKNDKVLAITGIVDMRGKGLIWSLFSEDMRHNFINFARASEELMDVYHDAYTTLVCDVWAKNHSIMQWLAFLGFEPEFEFTHNGAHMVRFVRCCGEVDYEIPFGQRPVLH
jgi:hypothetical protein